ncbi:MAG: HAD-IC family P-type ATPase [Clostridia bacterium]|nr:HAD-IC family P-type ATPase [Clostridia bacterium]
MKFLTKIKGLLHLAKQGDPTELNTENTESSLRDIEVETLPEGLASEEVDLQIALGNVNVAKEKNGKSYFKIIADNLFTPFNLIWAIVAGFLIAFDSYNSLTFLAVVVPNTVIAIIQEMRAKATVEKLSVTTDPKAQVVRDGELWEIDARELVLGDVVKIELGRQVLSDGIVLSGSCEANESMLTGESVPIKKQAGDRVYAGSFLVSGSVFVKIDKVGGDNYIHTLERAAKKFKGATSNLFRDLNRLTKTIGVFIIPMALAMIVCNYFVYRSDFSGYELAKTVVEKTCGSVVGMVPAGIYLLVTLTLSLSVMALAKKKTLVQDMYSIEMLASADVLCLDKTGTITDGTMHVTDVDILDGTEQGELYRVLSYMQGAEGSLNATGRALIAEFGKTVGNVVGTVPFSSERKYSAANIEEVGIYAIGAPHFVPCEVSRALDKKIEAYAERGERVLLLARLDKLDGRGEAVALIAIADRIRPNAKETIEKFQEQGVCVKVISGDHAATVSTIAAKVGIIGAEKYISCEYLTDEELISVAEEFTVFGRVTPEQKVLLIKTLKKKGHTVAMTGDGVNDTLALKEANCAIAMADGSEVARKISQIVLLNSDFGTLPDVVREGRRCINNVRQSSTLFLMKTLFTVFISLFSIITGTGYPFGPNNFFFLEMFIIGVASFLLALEPNDKRIEGTYLDTVLVKSFPCAVALFVPTLVILLVGTYSSSVALDARNAVAMCVVIMVGYINLINICRPYTKWRAAVVVTVGVLLAAGITVSSVAEAKLLETGIFGFSHALDNPVFFIWMMLLAGALTVLMNFFRNYLEKWIENLGKKQTLIRVKNEDEEQEN